IKSLGAEYAKRNVTANCIAPGFIKTPMTDALNEKQREAILAKVPAARLGTPEDIAAAAVYLASNEAAYVTGQTIHVNGGMAMISCAINCPWGAAKNSFAGPRKRFWPDLSH